MTNSARIGLLKAMLLCTATVALSPAVADPPAPPAAPAPVPPTGGPLADAPAPGAAQLGTIVPIGGDLSPLYGRIRAFYGDVDPSYGRIRAFYGRIRAFYDPNNPFWSGSTGFWGQASPFASSSVGGGSGPGPDQGIDAFWGKDSPYKGPGSNTYPSIGTFWAAQGKNWNTIFTAWNNAATPADAAQVATSLQSDLIAPFVKFWSPLVKSAGPGPGPGGGPGGGGALALIQSNLAGAGVTFNADGSINATSLLASDASQRAMLFLNLYDDLMGSAGTGHVDWWMGAVGWTPFLAQTQGATPAGGTPPTVGMIDFAAAVTTDANGKPLPGGQISKQLVQYGSQVFADGHGAAVGSLIMGALDGSGIMGVMPANSVNVIVYNPYDASNTTNWSDVGTGIATLNRAVFGGRSVPVGVLNASLGVPGWTLHPGWNDALKTAGAHGHDLVIAAGNDGITQTENVPWSFATNPTILIVGSVGVDGTISNFSNRPGEACLLPEGTSVCTEANKLKYRFVVAPGELILVSDGLGGHMRQSGTSLAAPLVSGAIGLLQNRWPWLANFPDETASIILRSATPKGTMPGADPVYGAGELNIAASQAPLSWANLTYYQAANGRIAPMPLSLSAVVAQIKGGTQSSWDATGLSYSAFETIGKTFRDFQIPLASKLIGQNVVTAAGGQAYQTFLAGALRAQAGRFAALSSPEPALGGLVSGFARSTVPAGQLGGATLRVNVAPAEIGNAFQMRTQRYETDAVVVTDRHAFQFGFGNGAAALDGSAGFAFRSDYDLAKGGANPLLGLASGGVYVGARTTPVPGLVIGFGATDRSQLRNLAAFGLARGRSGDWANRYAAQAQTVNAAYTVSRRLVARVSLTHLSEAAALLGIQSLDRADFAGGTVTDGVSAGFDLALGETVTLSGTGTLARTSAAGGQITTTNLTSAAAELGIVKSRLLARHDELRLSVASPLHTVGGGLVYSNVAVVDRMTGQLGVVTQTLSPRRAQPLAAQAMYGMALPRAAGEFSLFGRVDHASELVPAGAPLGYTAGAQVHLTF